MDSTTRDLLIHGARQLGHRYTSNAETKPDATYRGIPTDTDSTDSLDGEGASQTTIIMICVVVCIVVLSACLVSALKCTNKKHSPHAETIDNPDEGRETGEDFEEKQTVASEDGQQDGPDIEEAKEAPSN